MLWTQFNLDLIRCNSVAANGSVLETLLSVCLAVLPAAGGAGRIAFPCIFLSSSAFPPMVEEKRQVGRMGGHYGRVKGGWKGIELLQMFTLGLGYGLMSP